MTLRRINNGQGHWYKLDGTKADGVTTLIKEGLPAPALINWAANATIDYAIDHWDELSRVSVSERIKTLRGARFADRDKAARRGTEVHQLAERLLVGDEVEIPPELAGHVESYVKFLDEWRPRAVLVETPVASRRWWYAGTTDMVIDLPDGRRMVADIKTSRSGVFPETVMQLAAYRHAEFYVDSDGAEQPMADLGLSGALAIWVRADGYDVREVTADERQHRAFLHAATTARWARDAKDLISTSLERPAESAA